MADPNTAQAVAKSSQILAMTYQEFAKGMELCGKTGSNQSFSILAQAQAKLLASMSALAKWEEEQAAKARAAKGVEFTEHRSWDS